MRHLIFIFVFFTTPVIAFSQTLGNPAELPFTIALEEVTQDEFPGMHSFAIGRWDGWWVIIGGRINGLHGFFINTGFPEDQANAYVRLFNPETGENRLFFTESLNIPYPDALKATNPQYAQDGQWLYLCGGYGKDVAQNKFVTFPVLTAIDLSIFVPKMLAGENPSAAFRQITSENMRVCGGEMEKMGDWFYLVGGHNFSGLYNQNGPPQFTQTYTSDIRKFKISNGTSLVINEYSAVHDETNLHRRDFTLGPVVRPDGTEQLCLYGGVFRPDADLPYYNPVYIGADGVPVVDQTYSQIFSQYTCPVVPFFDSVDSAMYSIFFAGLSANNWNENTGQLEYDEKVPFINDISTFRRSANGTSREYVMPQRFDALLGTNMIFVLNENTPHFSNEVIQLDALTGPTFVGYLFGGIKAEIPNFTPSSASNRLFKVFLTPKTVNGTSEPFSLENAWPNPFSASDRFYLRANEKIMQLQIFHSNGQLASVCNNPQTDGFETVTQQLRQLTSGVYFLEISTENSTRTVKLVRQ